ncbi:hypothetical protein [Nocardia sp. NPDC059195]
MLTSLGDAPDPHPHLGPAGLLEVRDVPQAGDHEMVLASDPLGR